MLAMRGVPLLCFVSGGVCVLRGKLHTRLRVKGLRVTLTLTLTRGADASHPPSPCV